MNVDEHSKSDKFIRDSGFQGGGGRGGNWNLKGHGAGYKENLLKPGPWEFFITGFAECLPFHDNQLGLYDGMRDKWGLPTLSINAEWGAIKQAVDIEI